MSRKLFPEKSNPLIAPEKAGAEQMRLNRPLLAATVLMLLQSLAAGQSGQRQQAIETMRKAATGWSSGVALRLRCLADQLDLGVASRAIIDLGLASQAIT